MLRIFPAVVSVLCGFFIFAGIGEAGQGAAVSNVAAGANTPSGPPPPVPPAVISRDDAGHVTVRAVRVDAPIRLDGQLDEAVYQSVASMSDFIQAEPQEGAPATQKTEIWLLFDNDNLYVSARCWEGHPIVATEMRHDASLILNGNDNIGFTFDTFFDRRNGAFFAVNAIGGRAEGQSTNERQYVSDWNGVWDARVGRFDGGWTLEAAVPFKTLRYRPGAAQVWGFNVHRKTYGRNERVYLSAVPAARGEAGIITVSLAATVVGLEVPPGSRNLEIKPYAISDLTSDHTVTPRISNDVDANAGLDVKYGITQNLTADLTYNTDFAQVEADEQQINLTRFNLFFPEKREFFLENQGTFAFGGAGSMLGSMAGVSDTPILFYSRRIGLNQGRAVPIRVGGRLTGRTGRYSLGALSIRAADDPVSHVRATNFSVLRVKRDLLRKSSVGLMFTGRSVAQSGAGTNNAFGVDGNFAFFDNLAITTYWAKTRTDGLAGDDASYRANLDYAGDRYGVQLEHLAVGDNFNPEVGFIRRDDVRRSFAQFRFSPRPRSIQSVRKFSWMASGAYLENGAGRVDGRDFEGEFSTEFRNNDKFIAGYSHVYEYLPRPLTIASGITLPVGGYEYSSGRVAVTLAPHRALAGTATLEHGTFYNGHKTTVSLSRGRVTLMPLFSLEPSVSINMVDLVQGSFVATLLGTRVTYTMTPMMFVSALLQYNSDSNSVATNVRLRWEYQPGSELFVVYNEQRDTSARAFPDLANRAFIIKINRLFRF